MATDDTLSEGLHQRRFVDVAEPFLDERTGKGAEARTLQRNGRRLGGQPDVRPRFKLSYGRD